MNKTPDVFFSIVTVNLNNLEGLKNTLKSITSQNFNNYEIIVVDGLSNDGSVAFLETINYFNLKKIVEKDTGIYNAMNKGIAISEGFFLIFMNSGDLFYDSSVLQNAQRHLSLDTAIAVGLSSYKLKSQILYPPQKTPHWNWFLYNGIRHQSAFIARWVFEKVAFYNEQNKIVSDHEFFLLALGIKRLPYQALDFIVSIYEGGGISGNPSNKWHKEEFMSIFTRNIPPYLLEYYNEYEPLLKGGRVVDYFIQINKSKVGKILIYPFLILVACLTRFILKK